MQPTPNENSVAEQWDGFRSAVLGNMTSKQVEAAKAIFYAGAFSMFDHNTRIIPEMPYDQGMQQLNFIDQEFSRWKEEMSGKAFADVPGAA